MSYKSMNLSDQVRLIQLLTGAGVDGKIGPKTGAAMQGLTGTSLSDMNAGMTTEQYLDIVAEQIKNDPAVAAKVMENIASLTDPAHQALLDNFESGAGVTFSTAEVATPAMSDIDQAKEMQALIVALGGDIGERNGQPDIDGRPGKNTRAGAAAPPINLNDISDVAATTDTLQTMVAEGMNPEKLITIIDSGNEVVLSAVLRAMGHDDIPLIGSDPDTRNAAIEAYIAAADAEALAEAKAEALAEAEIKPAPSPTEIVSEFTAQAADRTALPEVFAFGADVVVTNNLLTEDPFFSPVSAIGDDGDVAAYAQAWENNPSAMADAVTVAIQDVASYLTSPEDYKLYSQAVTKYYQSDIADLTRPDGEGSAVIEAVKALGDALGFNEAPAVATSTTAYKTGLNG